LKAPGLRQRGAVDLDGIVDRLEQTPELGLKARVIVPGHQ